MPVYARAGVPIRVHHKGYMVLGEDGKRPEAIRQYILPVLQMSGMWEMRSCNFSRIIIRDLDAVSIDDGR